MQVNRKKNMGKHTATLVLTGFYMLATAHVTLAQAPKVQIDMAKINQALNQKATPGNGTTASSTMQNMQGTSASMGSTGNTQQPMPAQQVMDASMKNAIVGSDIMSEMQQKVMAENMKTIQKSMQESIMKSMMGSMQGSVQGSQQGPQGTVVK